MEVVVPQPAGGAASGRLETTYVVLYAVLEVLHKPSFVQHVRVPGYDFLPIKLASAAAAKSTGEERERRPMLWPIG